MSTLEEIHCFCLREEKSESCNKIHAYRTTTSYIRDTTGWSLNLKYSKRAQKKGDLRRITGFCRDFFLLSHATKGKVCVLEKPNSIFYGISLLVVFSIFLWARKIAQTLLLDGSKVGKRVWPLLPEEQFCFLFIPQQGLVLLGILPTHRVKYLKDLSAIQRFFFSVSMPFHLSLTDVPLGFFFLYSGK